MKFKLRRTDIILIVGFWFIGCALLGVVGYFILFQNQPTSSLNLMIPQATFTLVHTQITAKSMEPAAQPQLALWDPAAQLFAVTATWDGATLNQVGQPTAWTYRYYSPSYKRYYFIIVTADGQVMGTSHSEKVYHAPPTIPPADWTVDSPQALNLWINNGGAAMLNAIPNIQVVMQLQTGTPGGPLVWTVAGFDRVSKNYHTVFVNAATAEVTDIKTSLY